MNCVITAWFSSCEVQHWLDSVSSVCVCSVFTVRTVWANFASLRTSSRTRGIARLKSNSRSEQRRVRWKHSLEFTGRLAGCERRKAFRAMKTVWCETAVLDRLKSFKSSANFSGAFSDATLPVHIDPVAMHSADVRGDSFPTRSNLVFQLRSFLSLSPTIPNN